jgi:Ca-activated chloride channel homolog
MTKHIILFLFLIGAPALAFAQDTAKLKDPWKNTRAGNGLYKTKDYKGAEQKYRDALKTDTASPVVNHNLGNALYEQEKYDEAEKAYADALNSTNKDTLNKGWYNLGNSMYEQKKYGESVNAYKEALKNNPNDEDARYNLAMAQKKLKEQQQQQQQNSGGGGQDQKDQKDGQQDQKDGQQGDKDGQQGDKDGQQDQKDGQGQQPPLDPKKQGMSTDEANKVMNALKDSEQKTRQRLNQNSGSSYYQRSKDKDW